MQGSLRILSVFLVTIHVSVLELKCSKTLREKGDTEFRAEPTYVYKSTLFVAVKGGFSQIFLSLLFSLYLLHLYTHTYTHTQERKFKCSADDGCYKHNPHLSCGIALD